MDVSASNIVVTEDFYIAMEYTTAGVPVIGVDTDGPASGRSFVESGSMVPPWSAITGNIMIRAVVAPTLAPPVVTLSANPSSITVAAGSSASTTITFHIINGPIGNPIITCDLPTGVSCSTSPSPLTGNFADGSTFTLIVSASASTAPGTYTGAVDLSNFNWPIVMIQPGFLIGSPIQFGSSGGIGPSSISPVSFIPFVTITIIVNPAVIPEYPLGLPVLAIFMVVTYGLIRRRTSTKKS